MARGFHRPSLNNARGGPKCLFLINGLGLGNSTRCHAVMEHLIDAGCRLSIITSGNGLTYFEGKPWIEALCPIESFYYSGTNGGVSGWSTLRSVGSLALIARAKRARLKRLVSQIKPDVAVIDSEYTVGPLRERGIPVVGLNTSEMVVTEYRKRRHPRSTRSQFWFIEFSDYLFHKLYCNLVLSPFPLQTPTRHSKFRRIGLIARRAIRDLAPHNTQSSFLPPQQLRRVVFMLSGSVHASNICFEGRQFPFKIDVVGRPGKSSADVTFHGRQLDNTELLASADALVINGGYSAVSEALVLRKPTFVVPVPGHAEQSVNAHLIQELGFGFVASEKRILDQLLDMHARNEWTGLERTPPVIQYNGAREAAEVILDLACRHEYSILRKPVLA